MKNIFDIEWFYGSWFFDYRQTFNISRIKSLNLNVSRLVLQLSFPKCIEARC